MVNNSILVNARTNINSNNVETFETFSSRLVFLEVFDNTASFLCRNLADKNAMTCFVEENNQTKTKIITINANIVGVSFSKRRTKEIKIYRSTIYRWIN